MSTAAADTHLVEPAESPLTPESWGKLGMWNFLAGDAMSFGGLLAGYGALRYGDPNWPVPSTILGITLTAAMTFLLICSSVTMVEALAGFRDGQPAEAPEVPGPDDPRRHHLPRAPGLRVDAPIHHGQSIHEGQLRRDVLHPDRLPRHARVLRRRVPVGASWSARSWASTRTRHNNEVEIAALYWHFVDLVWILVFTFVYLV